MSKISLSANFLVNTSVSLDDYAVIIHTDIPISNFICRSDETVYDNSFPFPASIRLIKPEIVRFFIISEGMHSVNVVLFSKSIFI